MAPPWGWSAHFDVHNCKHVCTQVVFNDKEVRDGAYVGMFGAKSVLLSFLDMLIKRIKMKAYGRPMVHYFGSDRAKGWSVMQLIETSSISIHTTDDTHDLYIDVFSCKEFEPDDIIDFIHEFWSPDKIKYECIQRDAHQEDLQKSYSQQTCDGRNECED